MKLRIVLVEPREAGNVGAVARVMKNFGFDDLRIVGAHPELLPVSSWWASGADDVLERARFSPALLDAIGDTQLTIATTSSRGRTTPADFTPRTLAAHAASLGDDDTLALVFGREDSGLTREELMLCQRTAVIPANASFPTMNLAQSACVFCYELSSIAPAPVERTLARADLVDRLHERAQALLLEVGFLHADNPDHIYEAVRAIAGRATLDEREAEILLGMLRQVEWRIRTSPPRSSDRR